MHDDATLTLLSQRPMMFQESKVEIQDHVGALGTALKDADDHDLPPGCTKMLCDIVFCTHLDVFRRALLGDPPARMEPMTVGLQQLQGPCGQRCMLLLSCTSLAMRTSGRTCCRVG